MIGSDVNSRLPRFKEIVDAIDTTRQQGGFKRVPTDILGYLKDIEPVGLNEHGQVVLPEGYSPYDTVPVLALRPDETIAEVLYAETARERRAAALVTGKAGFVGKVQEGDLSFKGRLVTDSAAQVATSSLGINPIDGAPHTSLFPRLMVVGDGSRVADAALGASMAHEVDHWNFFLEAAPQLQRSGTDYTQAQLVAIAEKQAYRTSYTVEEDMGCYTPSDLPTFIENWRGIRPEDVRVMRTVQTYGATASLAAVAVSALFEQSGKLISADELTAFRALGIMRDV